MIVCCAFFDNIEYCFYAVLFFVFQLVVVWIRKLYLEIEKNKIIFNLPIDFLHSMLYLY